MDCCCSAPAPFVCLLVLAILLLKENKNASGLARADMDDTLYPLSLGINLACRKNIQGKVFYRLPS
jgi:hypothetical protein